MSEIPHPHAAHLPYLPEPWQWLWPFCILSTSGSVIFRGGGSFQFDIDNIGGMVLHRVALWSKNAILHYVICERPQSDFESLHNLAERYLEPVREANKSSNLSVQLEAIYSRRCLIEYHIMSAPLRFLRRLPLAQPSQHRTGQSSMPY